MGARVSAVWALRATSTHILPTLGLGWVRIPRITEEAHGCTRRQDGTDIWRCQSQQRGVGYRPEICRRWRSASFHLPTTDGVERAPAHRRHAWDAGIAL